jgi:PAS domain S-box-containing protein
MIHPPVPPAPRQPFRRDWLPLVLLTVGLGVLLVGGLTLLDLQRSNRRAREAYGIVVSRLQDIGELQYQIQETRRSVLYALTTGDPNLQVKYADQSREASALVDRTMQEMLANAAARTPVASSAERFARDWKTYLVVRDKVIASILEENGAEAISRDLQEGISSFELVRQDLGNIRALYRSTSDAELQAAETASNRSLLGMVLILCTTQLLAVGAVWTLAQRETRRVKHSETRQREVIESITEGMCVVGRTGQVELWNTAAEGSTGRARIDALGRRLAEVLPGPDTTTIREAVESRRREALYITLSGNDGDRMFEIRIFPFETGTTIFFRDVTEQRQLEIQLRQSQKMDAIGQLAGGVAHDFNNLLTVILGYAHFIAAEAGHSEEHQHDIGEIIKAADSAAALTKQLLAFGRKQMLQSTSVDVNAMVTGMSDMLGRLIGEHIQLVTVLAPALGPVLADQGQLEQVLMNLTVNARDAMPKGGRVVVETADVLLDESSGQHDQVIVPGSYVMLSVTDTGTGMSAETRRRLFEPFFTTKEQGKGTGLGLATVYGIVKQSGGNIWVFSELGQGTAFKVYLPRAGADAQPRTAATVVDVPSRGTETVLLVEDEDGVRHLAHRVLQDAGYQVLAASNPAEARELFAQHRGRIDLVLTDVIMPGSSGPDMFQTFALLEPALKVLYMSGYTEDATVRQARLGRGQRFVQKPFTAIGLARSVREALRQPDVGRVLLSN